ncbi:OmpA family protein [Hymenobacter latericus]|uniref:OmpA family protein n=1 Tax=Hymenobacter sp. YIM 151858-1 TaxID=2987688 RepID=UPI00222793E2|nr:OmpA family protein [Hymenobacter sp. YIM 151858-1]UYZ60334.1 OmpA family protein [Hymenobacter sp. YIM 151858-1]
MKQFVQTFRLLALPLALLPALPHAAQAQTPDRRASLGLNLSALQYQGNFGSDYWKFDRSSYAPGLAVNLYLGRGIDLNTQVFYGELTGNRSPKTRFTTTLVNANLGFKLKLNNGWALKENAFFQPYLLVGSGWSYASRTGLNDGQRIDEDKGYIDVMGGAGINLRLGGGVGLFVQSTQHMPMEANFDGVPETNVPRWADRFLQHTVGLTFNLGQAADADEDGVPDRQDRCANTPPGVEVDEKGCPPDTDNDGVADYRDNCPNEQGTADLQGCPDKDGDGVADANDTCPDVAGKEELSGCPDTDNDGIPDAEDKCPDTPAGTQVDASGCSAAANATETDSDADGVPNTTDRCPNSAGPASNNGCPEIKEETRKRLQEATQFIGFERNKATLLATSYATLDTVAQILARYPDYTLSITGHTDSQGPAAFNLRLSRERAAAARSYLVGKGIAASRVQQRGYGPLHPVADNATEAGRVRNRRVEFDLFLNGAANPADAKYGSEPTTAPATTPAKPTKAAPAKKAAVRKAPARKPAARRPPAAAKATAPRAGTAKKPAAKTPAKAPVRKPAPRKP